jgi:aldehyde dehydrogenase (NAD+)
MAIVKDETFAPILYIFEVANVEEAIALNNAGAAGTVVLDLHQRLRAAEASCRIAAATAASPTSTSAPAARRSAAPLAARRTPAAARGGSDCWKAYMRRQTNTINWATICRSRRASASAGEKPRRCASGTRTDQKCGRRDPQCGARRAPI